MRSGNTKTLALAAVFSSMASFAVAADTIKIGFVGPITGAAASFGKETVGAVRMVVAKTNASGGVLGEKIVLVEVDDACDPTQGTAAASKLVASGVIAVVGGMCSGAVVPALKIYGDAHIPFVIVGANSTKIVAANPGNAFLVDSTGDAQALTAMKLFAQKGIKTLAVIDEGDAYSADLAALAQTQFKASGGKVVDAETTAKGEQDFSALVTRITTDKADAVFWTAYQDGGALLVKQLRRAGYHGLIALSDGSNAPDLFTVAGSAVNGAYVFGPMPLKDLPRGAAFSADFVAATGDAPGNYSALAYDAAEVLLDAIKAAGTTEGEAIVKALKGTKYEGIAGPVAFTEKNTLVGSNFIALVAHDGALSVPQK